MKRIRWYLTGIVTLLIGSLLSWNYFTGGIPSHHLLARSDMPEISNAWGILVLPLLTWLLVYRIQKRMVKNDAESIFTKGVLLGFAGALIFGILISTFFSLGVRDVPGYMMLGVFPLALFVPLYRAEYLLGFVLGMTFTFGSVLPTGIGTILICICAVLYLIVRRGFLFLFEKLRPAN